MFHFGSAKVDVTPPAGLRMAGYGRRTQPAEGILSPLYVRASVCQAGAVRLALCSVDVVGICRESTNEIREKVEQATGIPARHCLIATTHTHAGPVTTKFRNASPDLDYMAVLGDRIAQAVALAADAACPAKLGFGRTAAPHRHYNRRKDNQPTDPELSVARFVSNEGRALGLWINYGCHPSILGGNNLLWSADFPGVLCEIIESESGGMATFFNGCLGDVGAHRPQRTFAEVERVGKGLAELALSAAQNLNYAEPGGIAGDCVLCNVPLDKSPTLEQLKALADSPTGLTYERDWAKEQIAFQRLGKPAGETVEIEFQWFRIGKLTVMCFPGQLFASWGLELRRRWTHGPLMIVNQANDHAGYFPDRLGWERGGYEARSAFKFNSDLPAPMTWEAGRTLVETALSLAETRQP